MLHHIEQKTFRSALMAELKQKLQHNNESAGSIIRNLQKILHEFEYRQNILVGFTLNSLLLWDLRCAYRLFRWQQHYAKDLPDWFGVIAEIDALISLSNYNYNHPNWAIPEIQENQFELVAKDMGHPLIDPHKCVTNDFSISGKEKMVIITGANMAGKSTFLRTVGVNLVLASCGCRVFANRFNFSPIRVFTNMRTTDNLMNDESYFYAELLRLQTILELLRKGEKLFVILDEMLKGTNSIDKLNGSKELIKQLTSLNTYGIVATHDLGLTELSLDYPEILKNQCFEVHLTSSELTFDYKLTEGVTQTMNATFLMKKMGIIPENKSK
jgi:DNA mismatch repair ATPase MutS